MASKNEKKQGTDSPVIRLTSKQIGEAITLYCRQELGVNVGSVTALKCIHRRNQEIEFVAEQQLSPKQPGGTE